MFSHIGKKIRVVGMIGCWIGIVLSVALGASLIILGNQPSFQSIAAIFPEALRTQILATPVIFGIAIIVLGSLFSWIGSFLVIGFGRIVESATNSMHQWESMKKRVEDLQSTQEKTQDQLSTLLQSMSGGAQRRPRVAPNPYNYGQPDA